MPLLLLLLWHLALACLATAQAFPEHPPLPYDPSLDKGIRGSYPVKKFVSSKLTAPETNVVQWSPVCDDGRHYFLAPRGWKVPKPGPMILASDGSMIWSKHFANDFGGQAYDFKVQKYKGVDHLTFWLGDDRVRGHGAGEYYMLNASYDVVHKIRAGNGTHADLHELVITPEGTALMIVFQPLSFDVRPAGRKFNDVWNQAIWDCLIQEVDIESGSVVFEWRASEHLKISDSYNKLDDISRGTQANPYDPFHFNSVQKDELGNYLVSVRNTHAIYYVDAKTKNIIWTLGGRSNDFMDLSDGYALNFAWQHDARFVSPSLLPNMAAPQRLRNGVTRRLVTLFDNAAIDWDYHYGSPYSRGLLLELTYPTPGSAVKRASIPQSDISHTERRENAHPRSMASLSKQHAEKVAAVNGTDPKSTVRVLQSYKNPNPIRSGTQGSLQVLPSTDDNPAKLLIGYGLNPVLTEYSSNGSVLCNLHFGAQSAWEKGDVQSYRAYKSPWLGLPKTPPLAAIQNDKIFVTWNGATEVRTWLLQASESATEEKPWMTVAPPAMRQGFETAVQLPKEIPNAKFLRLVALDEEGELCPNGISNVLRTGGRTAALLGQATAGRMPLLLSCTVAACGVFGVYKILRWVVVWRRRSLDGAGAKRGQA